MNRAVAAELSLDDLAGNGNANRAYSVCALAGMTRETRGERERERGEPEAGVSAEIHDHGPVMSPRRAAVNAQ